MNASPAATTQPLARYTPTAIALHWLLAAAILGSAAVGLYMTELKFSPTQLKLYNWHKWAGMTILALSLLRLLWRLGHRPPPLPAVIVRRMPGWQQRAHHATHGLMYLLFFLVPLTGWAYSSAKGFPIVWFGMLPLPDWVPVSDPLAAALKPLHRLAAYGLLGLVAVHVGAALKHQFIDRDGLLARMGLGRG